MKPLVLGEKGRKLKSLNGTTKSQSPTDNAKKPPKIKETLSDDESVNISDSEDEVKIKMHHWKTDIITGKFRRKISTRRERK